MSVVAKIENGKLIIALPLKPSPEPSSTGKTLLVASTHGTIETTAKVDGKSVKVSLNAYIKP